jgi:hypothetical protein
MIAGMHAALALPTVAAMRLLLTCAASPLPSAVQKMHMIMSPAGGLLAALGGDPLLLLAAYLAAVVHDYQHTGVTNAFLVTVGHDLAVTYNDVQPHENHHIAAAWRLTRSRVSVLYSNMTAAGRGHGLACTHLLPTGPCQLSVTSPLQPQPLCTC